MTRHLLPLLALLAAGPAAAEAPTRPNVVVILTDDQGREREDTGHVKIPWGDLRL